MDYYHAMRRFTITTALLVLLMLSLTVSSTHAADYKKIYNSSAICSKARVDLRKSQSDYRREVSKIRQSKNLIRTIIFAHSRYQREVEQFLEVVIKQEKKVSNMVSDPKTKPEDLARQQRKLNRMNSRMKQMDRKLLLFGDQLTVAQNNLKKYVSSAKIIKGSQASLRLRIIRSCK
jgi:hypothetical protein